MSSVNKAILIGNVGKDPEVKELKNGKVANMTLATSERYTDKNGDKQEKTEWHSIVFYGKLVVIQTISLSQLLKLRQWQMMICRSKQTNTYIKPCLRMGLFIL